MPDPLSKAYLRANISLTRKSVAAYTPPTAGSDKLLHIR